MVNVLNLAQIGRGFFCVLNESRIVRTEKYLYESPEVDNLNGKQEVVSALFVGYIQKQVGNVE